MASNVLPFPLRSQPSVRNGTQSYQSSSKIATYACSQLLEVAIPVAVSVLAWILLSFAISYVLAARTARDYAPRVRERLRLCYIPTFVLSLVQLGLALDLPIYTADTYNVKLRGKQEYWEVSRLRSLSFVATASWLCTIAVTVTVLGVFGVIVVALDWTKEMEAERERERQRNLPPLCP